MIIETIFNIFMSSIMFIFSIMCILLLDKYINKWFGWKPLFLNINNKKIQTKVKEK